jgi:hypothetical protein
VNDSLTEDAVGLCLVHCLNCLEGHKIHEKYQFVFNTPIKIVAFYGEFLTVVLSMMRTSERKKVSSKVSVMLGESLLTSNVQKSPSGDIIHSWRFLILHVQT